MSYPLAIWEQLHAVAGSLGQDPERYRKLADLEARYWGVDKTELADWDADVDLPERCPRIRTRLVRRLVDDTVDLLLGEGRFPVPLVDTERPEQGPQETPADVALALLVDHARAHDAVRRLATHVVNEGGGAITLRYPTLPPTHLALDVHPARHCIPTFGEADPALAAELGVAPTELLSLRVQYAYAEWEPRSETSTTGDRVWYVFRRDFTPTDVIDYEPYRLGPGSAGLTVIPEMAERQRVAHGLGRVPAVWARSRIVAHDSEGPGLVEGLEGLVDALDYGWTQLDDSVSYNLDPIPVLKGVSQSDADALTTLKRGRGHTLNLGAGRGAQSGAQPDASYLEIAGASHESARAHLAALRAALLDACRVVVLGDDERGRALSGVAMERLYRPMLALVDGYRERLGDAIETLYELLLQAGALPGVGASLRLRGAPGGLPTYEPSTVSLTWPPVFEPTAEDVDAWARALSTAVGGGILSKDAALERMAALLRITDVQRERERLQADEEAAMDAARAAFERAAVDTGTGADQGAAAQDQGDDTQTPPQ